MSEPKLDVVLFGATGYTGGLTAEYLAKVRGPEKLRWALAGRNRQKLEAVQARVRQLGGEVELLAADSSDESSLRAMARRTKVVITTVGPYLRYGEPLVRACVEEGTDYVDLTGEPLFVDRMLERYQERAEAQRVKIVNACGFDSIPHDLGALYAVHALRGKAGPLDEQKVEVRGLVRAQGTFSGGTWHSALGIMGEMRATQKARKSKDVRPIVGQHRACRQLAPRIYYQKEIERWALPLPTIDPAVVVRSARLDPSYGRDFRYGHYAALPNLALVVGAVAGAGSLFTLAQFKPTRDLLLKLKDPGEGPSEKARAAGWFQVTMLAKTGNTEVHCRVSGGDPGYGETAKMLAESALCLALKRASTPERYGVVPPAAALGVPLIERLKKAGMRFEQC